MALLLTVICRPPSVISFMVDNLSTYKWIFTKLGICINIVEILFEIANGQILSTFDRVICPSNDDGRVSHFTFFY